MNCILVQVLCGVMFIVVSFLVGSLEALDLDIPHEPKAVVRTLGSQEEPPPTPSGRELVFQDRFAFSKDEQHDDKRGCCPCGTHHCCGSMCHG